MLEKAVIVAAGMSTRLYPLTSQLPKGLLEINNEPILARSVRLLKENGIKKIALVIGFEGGKIRKTLGDEVIYLQNPFYSYCNNMGSLWFAKDFVKGDDFVYLHGDLIYDPRILSDSIEHFQKNSDDYQLVTDFENYDQESMKVKVDENNYLLYSNKEIPVDEADGEWIGIAYSRKSEQLFKTMEEILMHVDLNHYDTFAFSLLAGQDYRFLCTPTDKLPWVEIDYPEDFQRAKELFQ